MNIVQTFWSHDKSLTKYSFGWLSPQYNLMAWTLSSLRISKHYKNLHLFADSNAKKILIDYLDLPYSDVRINYDDSEYNQKLWAIPKLKTYSNQQDAFIHIDGDVFIRNKFKDGFEKADLSVQNIERGTDYYKNMMDNLKKFVVFCPFELENVLNKKSIGSINAGIFGGSDIDFINYYANRAFEFINKNKLNHIKNVSSNFNILFEQILFYSLANESKKEITSFLKNVISDCSYSAEEFCDFSAEKEDRILHIIGQHKKNIDILDKLTITLASEFPDYFYKIMSLFPEKHIYFFSKIQDFSKTKINKLDFKPPNKNFYSTDSSNLSKNYLKINFDIDLPRNSSIDGIVTHINSKNLSDIYKYENRLKKVSKEWSLLESNELATIDFKLSESYNYLNCVDQQDSFFIKFKANSHIFICDESFEWKKDTKEFIREFLNLNSFDENEGIAVIPSLYFKGYREIVIDQLSYLIITSLDKAKSLIQTRELLEKYFIPNKKNTDETTFNTLINIKLKSLLLNRLIYITS